MVLPNYNCVTCSLTTEETCHHLFFGCSFAREFWGILNFNFSQDMTVTEIISEFKNNFQSDFSITLFVLMCWCIWGARNGYIFQSSQPSVQGCKEALIRELQLVKCRINREKRQTFTLWIDSLISAN
jgi:hypothetical protein